MTDIKSAVEKKLPSTQPETAICPGCGCVVQLTRRGGIELSIPDHNHMSGTGEKCPGSGKRIEPP